MITDLKDIKTGDTMLVSTSWWLARCIQYFQKKVSPKGGMYNHAAKFWWCYDELFVIEALEKGVTISPFSDYYKDKSCKLLLLRPKFVVDGSEYGKFMLPYCGRTRYGFWNLLVAQSVKILTLGKVWLGKAKEGARRFICGEWAAFVDNHFNPGLFPEPQKIAPVDLYDSDAYTHEEIKIKY